MIKIRLPSHDLWLANHPELKTAQASTSIVMKLIIVIIHHPWSYVEFSNYRLTWYPQRRSSISLVPFTGGSPPFNICCFQNPFLKFEVSSETLQMYPPNSGFQLKPSQIPVGLVTIEKPPQINDAGSFGYDAIAGWWFFRQPCWIFFLPRLRMFRKKTRNNNMKETT